MLILLYIILSTLIVSLLSIIGIVTIGVNDKKLNQIVLFLVSLSAGGLLGGAFLHLLPEAVEGFDGLNVYLFLISGFILFFVIEKILDYRHCHNVEEEHMCEFHSFRWLNLIGDGVHNLIDGLILAAAYASSINLGIITTIAVIFHEIPQEIGDYGVLVYGGFSKKKALLLNFLSAIVAIAGGIIGYFLLATITLITPFLLAFAAGGFVYIAASDLIPELKKEHSGNKMALLSAIFIAGIILMWVLKIIFE